MGVRANVHRFITLYITTGQLSLFLFTKSMVRKMTREEIHNEIDNLVKLIEINNNRMVLNDSSISLDLEQMRAHIMKLYNLHDQLLISLKEGDEVEESKPKVEVKTPVVEEKGTPQPIPEPKVEEKPKEVKPKPKVKFVPEPIAEEPKEETFEEQPVEEVKAPTVEEPQVEEVTPEPEVIPEPQPEPEVVAPKPKPKKVVKPPVVKKKETKTAATGGDVYQRLKNTKLESIKKGISISKRYEIQNELFGNNPEVYNQSMKQLDSAEGLSEAMDYLESELMVKHNWDEEDSLVEEIRVLLERRYM